MAAPEESPQVANVNAPNGNKLLLLAEDDRATQNLFRAGLRKLSGYEVIIVSNGVEALEVLKERPVNVLVTDLHMPIMDGFELISIVYERYPHIPVLVMTGLAETTHQNAPMFLGALCILPKPVKLAVLIDQIREAGERKPDGVIQGIPLNSLLQLMAWERKSCTIVVESPQGIGMLYLQEGDLIHAGFKEFEGLDAAYKILGWTGSRVEFTDVCRANKTIKIPLTEVLLNAAMYKDLTNGALSPS
ncbi:MAG: response regulator [Holophagales bacterium]|jgi:CheY-like chemotaxis protein|nr:response regulator [Holophagales bacterium]